MSKKDKLHDKLFANPAPKDFRWDELITLLNCYGFEGSCSGGSHYIFYHAGGCFRLRISKTHPGNILKPYQIKAVKEAINLIKTRTI